MTDPPSVIAIPASIRGSASPYDGEIYIEADSYVPFGPDLRVGVSVAGNEVRLDGDVLRIHARHAFSQTITDIASFGNGMIMLGSLKESEFDELMKQPVEIGGAETQTPYIIVADADALYARAKTAGAVILLDIKDEDYGGRGFSCRNLWNFGTCDPNRSQWMATQVVTDLRNFSTANQVLKSVPND